MSTVGRINMEAEVLRFLQFDYVYKEKQKDLHTYTDAQLQRKAPDKSFKRGENPS